MMEDNRVTIHEGRAVHTATNAIFQIDSSGAVHPIYNGDARHDDLARITQVVLAEIEAERMRTTTGQFISFR
jgi:hypothetical protein